MLRNESTGYVQLSSLPEAQSFGVLHPDVERAIALQRAGLYCVMGGLGYKSIQGDKFHELSVLPNGRNFLQQRQAQGLSVYAGPMATKGKDSLTVYPSNTERASFGIWIPKEGIDSTSIPFGSTDFDAFTKGSNGYKGTVRHTTNSKPLDTVID